MGVSSIEPMLQWEAERSLDDVTFELVSGGLELAVGVRRRTRANLLFRLVGANVGDSTNL